MTQSLSVDVPASGGSQGSVASIAVRFERDVVPLLGLLHTMAYRLTRNSQDAEDLAQDTVAKAYVGFASFTEGTNLKAWLSRIMTNTHINNYRRKQRRPEKLIDDFCEYRPGSAADRERRWSISAEATMMAHTLDEQLQAALRELPSQFLEVILYADLYGYTYREIAAALGIPHGTVMSRLHRGRRRLRERLTPYQLYPDRVADSSCPEGERIAPHHWAI